MCERRERLSTKTVQKCVWGRKPDWPRCLGRTEIGADDVSNPADGRVVCVARNPRSHVRAAVGFVALARAGARSRGGSPWAGGRHSRNFRVELVTAGRYDMPVDYPVMLDVFDIVGWCVVAVGGKLPERRKKRTKWQGRKRSAGARWSVDRDSIATPHRRAAIPRKWFCRDDRSITFIRKKD